MELITPFLWGFTGSLLRDIPALNEVARKGQPIPKRFRKVSYWLIQLLVATASGIVVIAFREEDPIHAMYLGATTPLLLEHWQKKISGSTSILGE